MQIATALLSAMPGHARNASQGQHLIVERHESGDEDEAPPPRHSPPDVSTAGAFPASVSAPEQHFAKPHENKIRGGCRDPRFRSNYRTVCGAVCLTVLGAALIIYGILIYFEVAKHASVQYWMLVLAGLLFFVPGIYHVHYITCTLCGRPGYSFDKLPTFSR